MASSVWIYFLILHGANTLKFQDTDVNTERSYHVQNLKMTRLGLQKRSPRRNLEGAVEKGYEALNNLLRPAKLLYTNGYDEVLIKGGGYKQALSDFKSIDPDVITDRHAEVMGSKGSLVLTLSQDGQFSKMSLVMKDMYHNQFSDKPPEYTIFYKPTLAMTKDKGLP